MRKKIRFALLVSSVSILVATAAFAAPTKFVTGPDSGVTSQISPYSSLGINNGSFLADTSGFTGGVRVALANVVNTNDIIAGTGPGTVSVVKVFTGPSHNPVYSFIPFPGFSLGVYVAGGDINGDGRADIIVAPGEGAGSSPHVKVFSGANGSTILADFFAFSAGFTGGVRVASGDVDGDGRTDIIVGTGPGAAQVTVFSGRDLHVIKNFIAYAGSTAGIYVAAGDVNGDGLDDIITGLGNGASEVKVFDSASTNVLRDFFAFTGSTGGVRVASTDINSDARADIIAISGPGDSSRLRAFSGTTLAQLLDIVPYGSSTAGAFVGAIPRYPPQSLNLATRANVLTGDNALIGGFIVNGTDPKGVLLRGIGPSTGIGGALADPTLELYSGNTLLAENDNWRDTQENMIISTGLAPTNNLESAMVRVLAPGAYTAIVRGKGGTTGIGLVEAYDISAYTANSQLANLSTRGVVQGGDNVLIGGLILNGGTGTNQILARALGPSLGAFGVPNALSNPTLGLYDQNGALLLSNDNWRDSQEAAIQATGLAPSNDLESAILAVLSFGNYTAIVSGNGAATGVALVEVYNLQ